MEVLASEQAAGQTAVETLYRRYRRDVFALAYHAVGSRADAEDVAQTTFLNAHRALLRGAEPADERAWLLAIARNACKTRFRDRVRRPREEPLDESVLASQAASDEPSSSVVDALHTLHPRQRAVLVLQAVDGCSTTEIGMRLGLRRSAVDALLHRARAALRDELAASADPLACARTETLVELQLTGSLPATDQAALRAHLRTCPACATRARRLRARRRLASLLALPWELLPRLGSLLGHGGAGLKAATVVGAIAFGATAVAERESPPPDSAGDALRPTATRAVTHADASAGTRGDRVPVAGPPRSRPRPAPTRTATAPSRPDAETTAKTDPAESTASAPIASPTSSPPSHPSPPRIVPPPRTTSRSAPPLTLSETGVVDPLLETVDAATEDLALPIAVPKLPEPSLDQAPIELPVTPALPEPGLEQTPALPDVTPAAPPLPQLP